MCHCSPGSQKICNWWEDESEAAGISSKCLQLGTSVAESTYTFYMAAPNKDHIFQPPLLGAYIWPSSGLKIGGGRKGKGSLSGQRGKNMSFSFPSSFQ